MIVLSGATLVLANGVESPGTLIIDGGHIGEVLQGTRPSSAGVVHFDLHHHYIVPGFIDVHVHGLRGFDVLSDRTGVREIAARLPQFGVTAFCPTTVACGPRALSAFLASVSELRMLAEPVGARVLPAHLESNFINPAYRGAQPPLCLRRPPLPRTDSDRPGSLTSSENFEAEEVLAEIARRRSEVAIVTLAPELEGALPLIDRLAAQGHRVSLGHSAATFEEAMAGIVRGARSATHLFNRMPPLRHRDPGLAGAVLASDEVAAELICDGYHVHPAVLRIAIGAKGPERIMAITDGTAGSGLPVGSRARLGDQSITVGETAAFLDDGTLAGSVLTMDRAFAQLVTGAGVSLFEAAMMCSTTPARELGLKGVGEIAVGNTADFTVLDGNFLVVQTYVGGRLVYQR